MRTGLLLSLIVAAAMVVATASADTIVVDWSGGGDHMTIQDGINAADEGDTVLVMPGTYSGPGNRGLDFLVTNCVLMSSGGARSVTIDCGNTNRGLYFTGFQTAACIVDGFTITNGAANYGAAIYFWGSSPTIRNCTLTGNTAINDGGGAYCSTGSAPSFSQCTFSGNYAGNVGGGAMCITSVGVTFDHCTFSDNIAAWDGGGAYVNGCSPGFTNCEFSDNSITDAYGRGGGMYMVEGASPTIATCDFDGNSATWRGGALGIGFDCTPAVSATSFTSNSAEYGGAVSVNDETWPAFNSSQFYDNTAVYGGGAVYSQGGAVPTFEDCTYGSNAAGDGGGAMYFEYLSTPELVNCTLYANSAPTGSGIWCDDNFTMDSCIIVFGVGGEAVYCDYDPPLVSCSDIYGNAGGDWVGCLAGMQGSDGNFSGDPIFCDAPQGDFGIDVASPCTAPNSPEGCGLVGAWGINCDTPVQAESWGAIKAMYR